MLIPKFNTQFAILDVSMPKLDGLALARKLVTQEPSVGVILVTMYRIHGSHALVKFALQHKDILLQRLPTT